MKTDVKFISYGSVRTLNIDKVFRFYKSMHKRKNGEVLPVIRFQSESGQYENLTFGDEVSRDRAYKQICDLLNCIDIKGA